MKRNIILPLLLLALTSACAPAASSTPDMENEQWIIFSADQAEDLDVAAGFGFPAEYWTPSEAEVRALENGLIAFLQDKSAQFNSQRAPIWERLTEYNRQYAGLIMEGRTFIYANFFCDSMTDWKKDFVFVMDGGDCFFQFKYDPATGEFFDLQVNGEA